jgi:hypothetical protein
MSQTHREDQCKPPRRTFERQAHAFGLFYDSSCVEGMTYIHVSGDKRPGGRAGELLAASTVSEVRRGWLAFWQVRLVRARPPVENNCRCY